MKKLFIQFYLLLFVCFLVMSLLVGLVYKFTAERAGKQSLDDLMNSSLYLMRSELREIPPHDWGKTLKEMDLNLSFDLRVEPLSKYHLDDISMHRLRGGEIVALDDQYTFLQRIPRSHYVLAVGPVPYLYYLHQMRLLDIALIAFIAISLAFPVFIWMRPHWQDMLKLEAAAQRFGDGHLNERIHFDEGSSFERLGIAFNQMADNINALIASKKQLIDGSRKIMSIVEGIDYVDGKIQFNTLYRFQKTNEYMDDNMKLHIDGFHKKINCISDRLALKWYENDVDETTIKKYARSDWSAATAYEIYERGEVNGTA